MMSDFLNHHIILKFHITQIQQRGNQATGPHIGISNNALQLQIFSEAEYGAFEQEVRDSVDYQIWKKQQHKK